MRVNRIFILLMLLAISSCDTISQMASFVNCKYNVTGLSSPTIAGVNLTNINNVNSVSAASLLRLGTGILAGSLPFQTTLNINATNPNSGTASIEGLEWEIGLDNAKILTGMVDNRVTVAPNGSTIIPIVLNIDVMQMMKGESKDNIFKFVNNLLNIGDNQASKMTLRIKPTINVAGKKVSTGFININKTIN